MNLRHRLTGYEKRSERFEREFDIPFEHDRKAREIAGVPKTDRDAVGAYALTPTEARQIAAILGELINVDRYDWFYEPVPASTKQFA